MTARHVLLTLAAREHLKEIDRYSRAQWGRAQAREYLIRLTRAFDRIAQNPLVGRARPDLKISCRSLVEGRHVIYYREREREIQVLAILHHGMDAEARLGVVSDGDPGDDLKV